MKADHLALPLSSRLLTVLPSGSFLAKENKFGLNDFLEIAESNRTAFELAATGLSSAVATTPTKSAVLDLTNPKVRSNGSLQDASGNTVLFSLSNYPGGSGASNSFLRLRGGQSSTLERGYNTGGTLQFDTQKQGTTALRLSNLPTITIDNTTYYEFRIDLNESNSNPQIALSKLQVFQSNAPNLTGYNSATGQLGGLNPVINLNGTVQLNASLNSGSGVGDVLVYLPRTAFTGNPYIYTYAEFQGADSGFEEFSYGRTTASGVLADLSLTQTLSNTAFLVGDAVTFTLTLNNSGSTSASGVRVRDLLPSGFSFTNATPSRGTYNSQAGIWDVGSIASGGNATLTLTATVLNAATASAYTNVAEVISTQQLDLDSSPNNGDPIEDDYTSVVTPVVMLNLNKEFTNVAKTIDINGDGTPDQFIALPGDNVSFTITVTNNGTANATGVRIEDDLTAMLPVGLTVQNLGLGDGINLDASGGGDGNTQTIEVLFNSIAPGASKTITVNARVSTEYITPISFTGSLGTLTPATDQLNQALPEYYDRPISGTLFLNLGVTKAANQSIVNFDYLNFNSSAEVVSVNGTPLAPGSISDSARLDISTLKIEGTLNNGQSVTVLSVENLADSSPDPFSYFFDPDPLWGSRGYPTNNNSEFLPPGVNGISEFLSTWEIDKNNPTYQADLNFWETLAADGNLADTTDEQAVIDTLVERFIEKGVYSFANSLGGFFRLNNGSETQILEFEAGEIAPTLTDLVNILITDLGAVVTNNNGNPLGSFANLEAALSSFNFANPTGVNITIRDSSGDGAIVTRLQEIGGFNFDRNWSIQNITLNSNVTQLTFASTNGSANLDFSRQRFVGSNTPPAITLRGDNAVDTIIGTRFADRIEGLNGGDRLSGFDGNDTIIGALGQDTLIGGRGNDVLQGGLGVDTFVFGANFGNDQITDILIQDFIDLSELNLTRSALDSNSDGLVNAIDNLADLIGGNLVLDLTSFSGGTIQVTGLSLLNIAAFIL